MPSFLDCLRRCPCASLYILCSASHVPLPALYLPALCSVQCPRDTTNMVAIGRRSRLPTDGCYHCVRPSARRAEWPWVERAGERREETDGQQGTWPGGHHRNGQETGKRVGGKMALAGGLMALAGGKMALAGGAGRTRGSQRPQSRRPPYRPHHLRSAHQSDDR